MVVVINAVVDTLPTLLATAHLSRWRGSAQSH